LIKISEKRVDKYNKNFQLVTDIPVKIHVFSKAKTFIEKMHLEKVN